MTASGPPRLPERPRVVLFDLDGTLTDSEPGIVAGIAYGLVAVGRAPAPPDQLRRHIGPPLEWGFREISGLDAATAERATAAFREYYGAQGWAENRPYPGVPEMLAACRAAGITLGVATSKLEPMARRILEHFALASSFAVICGAGLDERSADKQAIVAAACAALGAEPASTVMVGDRVHDIEAAAALGLASIAVTWGYGAPDEHVAAGAVAHSPAELLELLGVGVARPTGVDR